MRNIVISLVSCLLIACSTAKPKSFYITDEDFKESIKLHRSASIDVFGKVKKCYAVDSLILISLSQNDSIFSLYNANSLSKIKSWGNIGRAGNEYLHPSIIKYDDAHFAIWGKTHKRMEIYNVHNISDMCLMEAEEVNDMANLVFHAGDNIFVYERLRPREISLFRWRLGEAPSLLATLKEYDDLYQNSEVYSGFLEADESKNRVIYAFQFMDGFDLFDMNGSLLKKVRRKNSSAPSLNNNGGIDGFTSNTYCFDLRKGKDSFFLYRVGFSGTEWIENMERVTYIEEYDWDGNPLRRYELPMIISGFDCIQDGRFVIQDNASEDAILQIFTIGN
jgi:hypothetical protein